MIPNAVWSSGDFSRIGAASVIVGELLCDAVPLRAGQSVLDVATGAGNTALSAARRATTVTGVDFVPALLERARERTQAEHLRVDFREADARSLPFADHSFDVVLSTFGHMFAPDPARTASEMARVAKPQGRIAFTAWTPDGYTGQMFRINGSFQPPPSHQPVDWGTEDFVRRHFAPHAAEFRFTRRHLIQRALTAQDRLHYLREFLGPAKMVWESLDARGREQWTEQMLALLARFNQSGDTTQFVPSEYLETVIELK